MKTIKTNTITITKKQVTELLMPENLLPFNRKISKDHSTTLRDSYIEFGLLRLPVLAKLIYDDSRLAIADSQHLLTGILPLLKAKDSIEVITVDCKTKKEVIDLISKLNTTSKSWMLDDYLNAWLNFGMQYEHYPSYELLKNRMADSTMSLSKILDIFVADRDLFKKGVIKFNDMELSQNVYHLAKHFRVKYNTPAHALSGIIQFGHSQKWKSSEDVDTFISRIDNYKEIKSFPKDRDDIRHLLIEIDSLTDCEFNKQMLGKHDCVEKELNKF
jgi:hypothetical protein